MIQDSTFSQKRHRPQGVSVICGRKSHAAASSHHRDTLSKQLRKALRRPLLENLGGNSTTAAIFFSLFTIDSPRVSRLMLAIVLRGGVTRRKPFLFTG